MGLETMLVSLYVLVDDWWANTHLPSARKPGRPPSLSESEVLTLAILTQWPRWRSERDFFRFADTHSEDISQTSSPTASSTVESVLWSPN